MVLWCALHPPLHFSVNSHNGRPLTLLISCIVAFCLSSLAQWAISPGLLFERCWLWGQGFARDSHHQLACCNFLCRSLPPIRSWIYIYISLHSQVLTGSGSYCCRQSSASCLCIWHRSSSYYISQRTFCNIAIFISVCAGITVCHELVNILDWVLTATFISVTSISFHLQPRHAIFSKWQPLDVWGHARWMYPSKS